jgi:hypothetical protein
MSDRAVEKAADAIEKVAGKIGDIDSEPWFCLRRSGKLRKVGECAKRVRVLANGESGRIWGRRGRPHHGDVQIILQVVNLLPIKPSCPFGPLMYVAGSLPAAMYPANGADGFTEILANLAFCHGCKLCRGWLHRPRHTHLCSGMQAMHCQCRHSFSQPSFPTSEKRRNHALFTLFCFAVEDLVERAVQPGFLVRGVLRFLTRPLRATGR